MKEEREEIKIVVMEPTVENISSSENVSSEETEGDIVGEEPIERFGDFDNREDGR